MFWIIIAIVCGIAEIILPSFAAIFGSVPALIVAGIAFFTKVGWQIQIVIFAVTLLLSVYFIRPRLLAKLKESKGVPSRINALLEKVGTVTVASDPVSGLGRAQIEGNDWAVKSETSLEINTKIKVVDADGIVLKVIKI